jgi:hypothetical protein
MTEDPLNFAMAAGENANPPVLFSRKKMPGVSPKI